MQTFAIAGVAISLLAGSAALQAQETTQDSPAPGVPEMPKPQKEHQWLQQLVGEWNVESEANFGPDQPSFKCSGTESVRSLGGFWTVGEGKANMMGMQVNSVMTLGYDPQKKKYVGTWVDSVQSHMWHYTGTLDESGKVLTLEAEGPNMLAPGEMAKYRDVIEIKSKDEKILRSSMQNADGEWVNFMTATYTRKK